MKNVYRGMVLILWICHLLLESFIYQGCLIQHRQTVLEVSVLIFKPYFISFHFILLKTIRSHFTAVALMIHTELDSKATKHRQLPMS